MSCDGHKKVKAILKDLEYLVVIVIDAGGWEVVGLEARKARGQPLKLATALPGVS